jgi:CHASE3 domain sensor protein
LKEEKKPFLKRILFTFIVASLLLLLLLSSSSLFFFLFERNGIERNDEDESAKKNGLGSEICGE